jgi:hypothetical protein
LKVKGVTKENVVTLTRRQYKAYMQIAKGYKDECIFDNSQSEACMFVVNQEQSI